MAWFLLDFGLIATILRALVLSVQALALGGVLFVCIVLRPALRRAGAALEAPLERCRRGVRWAAAALVVTQLLYIAVDSAILIGTVHLPVANLLLADYFLAGAVTAAAAVLLAWLMRSRSPRAWPAAALPSAVLLAGSIWTSHAASRLDDRAITAILTGLHQLAAAAWIGAMPFLLVSLAALDGGPVENGRRIVRRYSTMALVSVFVLIAAGVWLSIFYVGSWPALYGTAYGFMIVTKAALLCGLLALGAVNWTLVRGFEDAVAVPVRLLDRLRRVTEAEVGIGFSILLAAASLTSQPPAVDLVADRLTAHEIIERFRPIVPRFSTPPLSALSAATPLDIAVNSFDNSAMAQAHNQDPDIAWSEYSHHWAGVILLCLGCGALLSRRFAWARHWPLGFIALAVFAFVRGDTENWPFGPIGFWKSFYDPEVLMHRVYELIFFVYAGFEWGVQTGRLRAKWAAYVWPVLLGLGGAGLLLHDHALGNVKNDLLIEMSHNQLAVLAVFAAWARWLEVRSDGRIVRVAAYVWPVCLTLIGIVLLNYREA